MLRHTAGPTGAAVLALATGLLGAPVAVADDAARAPGSVTVTLTDLGVLGQGARAEQVTDSGVVIGSFATATGNRAFRWVDGVMTDLPDVGGPHTGAADVNERGQVAGWSNIGTESHAVLWQPDGTVVDLGTPGASSEATGLNRLGAVAGNSFPPDGPVRAVVWRHGVMRDMGDLGGGWSNVATPGPSINDVGQVAGTSVDMWGMERAYRWHDGVMTTLPPLPYGSEWSGSSARGINRWGHVLGTTEGTAVLWGDAGAARVPGLGGTFVSPTDFNDRGQVAGSAETADGAVHAFLSQGGTVVDLGTLGGRNSEATALNRRGQVVGSSAVGSDPYEVHAVLWDRGEVIDLGTLGGTTSIAHDINRRGEIVGWSVDEDGVEHAVMWTVDH